MHRFYLPPEQCHGENFVLGGREAHHALRVLRVRTGENVSVLDGAGRDLECVVTCASRDTLSLRVLRRTQSAALPASICLVQAIPKGKIIESIIQKATELGAARVVPLLTERVIHQFDAESGEQKAEKWQHVAIEAIKQSGNRWLPRIEAPITAVQLLASPDRAELFLIGSLRPDARHPREHIDAFVRAHSRAPRSVWLWIGPEGDFTEREYDAAQAAGALPMTFGGTVLRCETAATYGLSVLSYEMQWCGK